MKWLILAACLVVFTGTPSAPAAESGFFIDDNGAANAADEGSTSVNSRRSTDPIDQNYGILPGKTLVRLDSRYGDISVETIFGKVNGAQVHLTW